MPADGMSGLFISDRRDMRPGTPGGSSITSRALLGWSEGPKRHFFIRQLRDMKLSVMVETFGQTEMDIYAGWCGRALALSHARSGNSSVLAGYMGRSDVLDKAIAEFSVAYADQNERDHAALARAVKQGTVPAVVEEGR